MTTENNNTNDKQILLPPQTSNKKTLVLDLDETLVHSQFMTFSDPSDVVIQIEIENEIHDIHVMVRPGVKEFLEKMEKLYEIVIFTASVSKYADPLLDIIDKKGYCPFRLFREHCSLINTTFVKDLQRLGRDLKNIIIVDNSPLSYALHPENGLPILTWFEDKSDRELYEIIPVLEFLSSVQDVREFIPKFVGKDNKINYDKANEIMKNYNGPRIIINDNGDKDKNIDEEINKKNNNNYKNNDKEINIKIISNNSDNNVLENKKNAINDNNYKNINKDNKENIAENKDKLVEMAMKNIIASVSPNSNSYNNMNNNNNNPILRNKGNSKNKIFYNNKKNNTHDEKLNKEKNNMKIDIANGINVKKLSNGNNIAHSTKKFKASITEDNFKASKQKRKNYSTGGNYLKNGAIKINSESKSIILKSENNKYNNLLIKTKNATPKINKTINLLNKSNHTTRSVKYTKKTNTYIIIPTSNNGANANKMSKSLTKNSFNSNHNKNVKKENLIQNKNIKNIKNNINSIYKSFNSPNTNTNNVDNQKYHKSINEFKSLADNRKDMTAFRNSAEKPKKTNKKKDAIKNKNNFLKTGFIQHKIASNKINNININMSNNLSLSYKFNNNTNMNNINSFDYTKTNRGMNKIQFNLTNNNILKTNYGKNYSPNNRYAQKQLENLNIHNNHNHNQNIKAKINIKNNSVANSKGNNMNKNKDNKKINNDNAENNGINVINRIKTARPKSTTTIKFENKNSNSKNPNIFENKKNKAKYQSKMKFEINEILQKRGISGKINDLKKEMKKI